MLFRSPYDYNSTVTVLDEGTMVKTGYQFTGWNTAANGSGTPYAIGDQFAISSNVALYAQWNANGYDIVFNANGGSGTMSNQTITYATTASLTANAFTRTGYTFAGWATSAGGAVAYADGANYTMNTAANVNLYAKWTANSYTVTFDGNGGGSPSLEIGRAHV